MTDTLYETDALAWGEREADLLGRLRNGERLNAVIDWANVIEEIRDVGLSELHACQSLLRQALIHLLKLTTWPDSRDVAGWRREVDTYLYQAGKHFTPSMRQRISVSSLYEKAMRNMRSGGDLPDIDWPETTPLILDDLLRDPPDIDWLLATLAGHDAPGRHG